MDEQLFKAIREDDIERFTYIVEKFVHMLKSVEQFSKNTLLHSICEHGAEKIFEYYYPKLKKPRKNMFNKWSRTPFAFAVKGPSDKIFYTMLDDTDVEIEKIKKDPSNYEKKPILSTVFKPEEYWDRTLKYYEKDSTKWKTSEWFTYAMSQKAINAVKLFVDNGLFDKLADYSQVGAMREALRYSSYNTFEYMLKHDITLIYVTHRLGGSPITESFNNVTKLETVFAMFDSLEASEHPFDAVVFDALRYNNEHALIICNYLMSKNIPLSDNFVITLYEDKDRKSKQAFYDSITVRKDYDKLLEQMKDNDELFEKYAPTNIKNIFMF